ncbi:MAG: MATE family efflux transporter [Burkholderiaceae bacterium]|nr:MATE family efflux transporter [Burkholderiaceae bacterium]
MDDNRPLWKTFLVFLLPLLLSNILQSLSGTISNVYMGQMLGVKALATVTAFFPVLIFLVSFMFALGAGASILIGQAWGTRNVDTIREVAGSTLVLGVALGLLIAIVGGTFTEPMLRLLGTPPDILPDATGYARILLIAMPVLFVCAFWTAMLPGVGDTVTPLYTLIISNAVGLILTPALIRGWWGLPQLGILSSAYALLAAFVSTTLWMAFHLRRKNSPLKPDADFLRHLHLNPHLLKNVLRLGIPTGIQANVEALAVLALLSIVNAFGSNATAAYGAVAQVVAYAQFPAISVATAASILGAQAIGARRVDRLGAITRTALLMNVVLTGSVVLLCYLLSRQLMGFFITSAPVIEEAQKLLHIMLWSIVIFGMASTLSGIMRASGTVLVPTLISIACILLVQLPTAWFASRHMGLGGVWVSFPALFGAMLALNALYYRLVWNKKPIRQMI